MSRLLRRLRGRPGDAGFTLVELIVSMSLLAVISGIFMGAVVSLSNSTVKQGNLVAAADANRVAFSLLDKQIHYADGINTPGYNAAQTSQYVEFHVLSYVNGTANDLCYQWKWNVSAGTLSWRTMSSTGTSPSAFTQAASGLRNTLTSSATTAGPVFSASPLDSYAFPSAPTASAYQQLGVNLANTRGSASAVPLNGSGSLRSVFSALNSTSSTTSTALCGGVSSTLRP